MWRSFCRISVTFVDKDGEEKHIKVPIGMSMLEAAHENDIELEGKYLDASTITCSILTCNLIFIQQVICPRFGFLKLQNYLPTCRYILL